MRPEDFDSEILLGKVGTPSIQQTSKCPITPACLSALDLVYDRYASSAIKKIILSSIPVKTAELSLSSLLSKLLLKARYYLREGTKLRKFLFPRWQFHKLANKCGGLCFATVTIETDTSTWINKDLGFHPG